MEQLYSDFDYPSEVRGFVRYTPPEDGYEPKAHSGEENMSRLFEKWESFIGASDEPEDDQDR